MMFESEFILLKNGEIIAAVNGGVVMYNYRGVSAKAYRNHKLMDISGHLLTEDSKFLQFYDLFMNLDRALFSNDVDLVKEAVNMMEPYRKFIDDKIKYVLSRKQFCGHMFDTDVNDKELRERLYQELCKYIIQEQPTFAVTFKEFLAYMI